MLAGMAPGKRCMWSNIHHLKCIAHVTHSQDRKEEVTSVQKGTYSRTVRAPPAQ